MLPKEIKKIYIKENEIKKQIKKKVLEINEYYKKKEKPIVVCSLKGSIVFLFELAIKLNFDFRYEFIEIKNKSKNKIYNPKNFKWITNDNINDRNILVVEDIIKSGTTMEHIKKYLKEEKKVNNIKIITLILKKMDKNIESQPDWVVLEMPKKETIVGWGFDYYERLRHLPYIGLLKDKYK